MCVPCTLTCFPSGGIHHYWFCTPSTITSKCPCCNPVLSTWYCRADCNSPPSTCIHILSYHWYSKAKHLIPSNQWIGYVIISLNLVFHCWVCNSAYNEAWDYEGILRRKTKDSNCSGLLTSYYNQNLMYTLILLNTIFVLNKSCILPNSTANPWECTVCNQKVNFTLSSICCFLHLQIRYSDGSSNNALYHSWSVLHLMPHLCKEKR